MKGAAKCDNRCESAAPCMKGVLLHHRIGMLSVRLCLLG